MKTKILFAILCLAVLLCPVAKASTLTESERQALLEQIQAKLAQFTVQVNQMVAQQASAATSTCQAQCQVVGNEVYAVDCNSKGKYCGPKDSYSSTSTKCTVQTQTQLVNGKTTVVTTGASCVGSAGQSNFTMPGLTSSEISSSSTCQAQCRDAGGGEVYAFDCSGKGTRCGHIYSTGPSATDLCVTQFEMDLVNGEMQGVSTGASCKSTTPAANSTVNTNTNTNANTNANSNTAGNNNSNSNTIGGNNNSNVGAIGTGDSVGGSTTCSQQCAHYEDGWYLVNCNGMKLRHCSGECAKNYTSNTFDCVGDFNGSDCYNFSVVLSIRSSLASTKREVAVLQTALIKEGLFTNLTDVNVQNELNNKSFGYYTKQAVIRFQEKYASEILTPQGLANGTGIVSTGTIKKLNQLYGCKKPSAAVIPVDVKVNGQDGPLMVASGTNVTISWTAPAGSVCFAGGNGFSKGNQVIMSSGQVRSPSDSTSMEVTYPITFTLNCTGTGNSYGSDTVLVKLLSDQRVLGAPIVNISSGASQVAPSSSATLTWTSSYANSCTASDGWTGSKATSGTETIQNITSAKTFTLTCSSPAGSTAKSVTVNVSTSPNSNPANAPDGAPNVIFLPSNFFGTTEASTSTNRSISVTPPSNLTLSWSALGVPNPNNVATSCTASGDWSGNKATNGTEIIQNITSAKTFTLTCSNSAGSASKTITVSMLTPAAGATPVVDVWITDNAGYYLGYGSVKNTVLSSQPSLPNAVLHWSAINSALCTASGDWEGTQPTSGSKNLGDITSSKRYILSCANGLINGSDSIFYNVSGTAPAAGTPSAAKVNLTANGKKTLFISNLEPVQLRWTQDNYSLLSSCTASGNWTGSKSVVSFENMSPKNGTYTITCTGPGGVLVSDSVTVETYNLSVFAFSPINSGESVNLNWSATSNLSSCTASGDWSGSKANTGNETFPNVTSNKSYTLTCQNTNGESISRTTTVAIRVANCGNGVCQNSNGVFETTETCPADCPCLNGTEANIATLLSNPGRTCCIGYTKTASTTLFGTYTCKSNATSTTRTLSITSPHDGDVLVFGNDYTVTWQSTGLSMVKVRMIHHGKSCDLATVPAATGSYAFTANPNMCTNAGDAPDSYFYEIQMQDAGASSTSASSGYFQIKYTAQSSADKESTLASLSQKLADLLKQLQGLK